MKRNSLYYEFWKQGSYVKTGFKTIGKVEITTGIDTVPTMQLTIPLGDMPEENLATYDIRVYIQIGGKTKYKFIGVVDNMSLNYADYTVTLHLSHRISRMREWLMPNNYTVTNSNVSYVVGKDGAALGYQDTVGEHQPYDMTVEIVVENDPTVEMTFSSGDKLSALSEVVKNTEKLHWRVDLSDNEGDRIIIGEFGTQADCTITPSPVWDDDCDAPSERYVTMLTEPVVDIDYTGHANRAVVFCGDLGEGVLHLTLKEIYEHPELWVDGFPIGYYDTAINLQPEPEYTDEGRKINNEKIYENNEVVAYANNTNREFYVTDSEQLNRDGGIIKHTTFNFSDLYPIPKLEETDDEGNKIEYAITDDDRVEMGKRAYLKAIRELKAQRPLSSYQFNCTALPVMKNGADNVVDGSKVNFAYIKQIDEDEEDCGTPTKRDVVKVNKNLYLTRRTIIFDSVLNEYTTVTLDEELRPRAINAVELALREAVEDASDGTTYESKYSGTVGLNTLKQSNYHGPSDMPGSQFYDSTTKLVGD